MNVLITGTASGIGRETAIKCLEEGFTVYGLDIKKASINHYNYYHFQVDVSDKNSLPELKSIDYIVNNAGIVTPQADAIGVNLIGYINVIEKYGYDKNLKSIVNIGSTASFKGYDNIRYCVSQGGRDALTKWCANWLGNDSRHVLCNSINLDGIIPSEDGSGIGGTSMEPNLYADKEAMEAITNLSVLKKLTTVRDAAEWIYFVLVKNTVMTGQILSIDGELTGAWKFIKYEGWDA